jgi:hypothetical protein
MWLVILMKFAVYLGIQSITETTFYMTMSGVLAELGRDELRSSD